MTTTTPAIALRATTGIAAGQREEPARSSSVSV